MNKKTKAELDAIKSRFTFKHQIKDTTYTLVEETVMEELSKRTETSAYERKIVYLITDGGCVDNGEENAKGSWSAILITNVTHEGSKIWPCKMLHGTFDNATNNRAELIAIREGASQLTNKVQKLVIVSDSKYAIDALKGINKRKKNVELIESTEGVLESKAESVKFTHVTGHSGFLLNELADALASGQLILSDFEN